MSRQCRNLLLIFALVVVSAVAACILADEAAGTIRTVDAKSRTVVLRVDKDKALELTVSRKAKITIDGKESAIEALRAGQKAAVTYAADAEIATDVKATSDATAVDEAAADMKWLQGEWKAVRQIINGKESPKADLNKMNKRLSVKGSRFVQSEVFLNDGKLGEFNGKFELDATTNPKQFNWIGKGRSDKALEWEGIYQVDKDLDRFTIFYVFTGGDLRRPASFDFATEKGFHVTFMRDKE